MLRSARARAPARANFELGRSVRKVFTLSCVNLSREHISIAMTCVVCDARGPLTMDQSSRD